MATPLIGVTSYPRNHKDRIICPSAYLDAIARAGGTPVIIPSDPITGIEQTITRLDGLILSGGGDVDPALYDGDVDHEMVAYVNAKRDEVEFALLEGALSKELPTLAICRGLQVVNVALGGTLHEHLPDAYGEKIKHRITNIKRRKNTKHWITVDEDSQLFRFLGETRLECTSFHHQCIDELAPGFKVVATADDGVIEAIESPAIPKLISVQWHPEYIAEKSQIHQRLFDVLGAWAAGDDPQARLSLNDGDYPNETASAVSW